MSSSDENDDLLGWSAYDDNYENEEMQDDNEHANTIHFCVECNNMVGVYSTLDLLYGCADEVYSSIPWKIRPQRTCIFLAEFAVIGWDRPVFVCKNSFDRVCSGKRSYAVCSQAPTCRRR